MNFLPLFVLPRAAHILLRSLSCPVVHWWLEVSTDLKIKSRHPASVLVLALLHRHSLWYSAACEISELDISYLTLHSAPSCIYVCVCVYCHIIHRLLTPRFLVDPLCQSSIVDSLYKTKNSGVVSNSHLHIILSVHQKMLQLCLHKLSLLFIFNTFIFNRFSNSYLKPCAW